MWIKHIPVEDADDRLRGLYDRIAGPGGSVDNIMLVHSLRPHTMEGHMALYKRVLHHGSNTVEQWFLEVIGIWVSLLNGCEYCVEHHAAGLRRLLGDPDRARVIRAALTERRPDVATLDIAQMSALGYAARLTQVPSELSSTDIEALRVVGWDDGQILEINQAAAYFAYANRTVLGLGVTTEGDVLGFSPGGEDPDDWGHR